MEKQKQKRIKRMKELLTRTIKAISRKPPAAFTNKGAFCVSTAGINMTRTGQTFMITRTIKSVSRIAYVALTNKRTFSVSATGIGMTWIGQAFINI